MMMKQPIITINITPTSTTSLIIIQMLEKRLWISYKYSDQS